MATAAKQQTKTSNGAVSPGEIDEQIARLRDDISSLGKTVASFGAAKAGEVSDEARAKTDELAAASRQALNDLSAELARLEKQVHGHVRRHPVQSLGIAAGVGFLIAMLLRR